MSTTRYAIIGAGRQGTAAAYDIAKWGDPASIIFADVHRDAAQSAAQRINDLTDSTIADFQQLDVTDPDALIAFLQPVDVFICATPFIFIPACTQAALDAKSSMVDLGGHTGTVLKQLDRTSEAQANGISIVPDCGMGPGMNNTLGVYVVEQLKKKGAIPKEVRLWDGGLPQEPPEPWRYQVTFHINGLTNEYDQQALVLRDGKVAHVDTLTEVETIEFEGIGQLEAFVTSGGTSTVPYTYEGQLQVYENKTCRYPGHYAQFKAFKDLGLFSEEEITINGKQIVPRDVYHHLLRPQIEAGQVKDVCVMRAEGKGEKDGETVRFVVDLIDRYDPATGFTAMERLTGWHAAIMAQFIASGDIAPGAWPVESAIKATRFMDEVRRRGFQITERWL